jgi:hypothetical protein
VDEADLDKMRDALNQEVDNYCKSMKCYVPASDPNIAKLKTVLSTSEVFGLGSQFFIY